MVGTGSVSRPRRQKLRSGRFGNEPAVYISWFDALAFCRWLSRRVGFTVSLPDEWQWQQAASGGIAGNVYPWGSAWDPEREPHRANTFESYLGRTTAVGMYPAGASSTDALDMAGTVWEWCLNKHEEPGVNMSRADDFEPRVRRGGSWLISRGRARCAYRGGSYPGNRSISVGFRVVCSSPITNR